MRLAGLVGLDVAPVKLERVAGKDVILIVRFDREKEADSWLRRGMVSALTLLELDEMMARYASYEELASKIRHRFREPKKALHELFGRLLFNVLCGNTDDHARNHAAFWNGKDLRLTPAYDICPQARTGNEASQAMLIVGDNRMSKIAVCLGAAPAFLLTGEEAKAIAKKQIRTILKNWESVCDEAKLTQIDRRFFWRRQFLNPFAFEDAPKDIQALIN
jgi:serine/threonine-protein kinase HipA